MGLVCYTLFLKHWEKRYRVFGPIRIEGYIVIVAAGRTVILGYAGLPDLRIFPFLFVANNQVHHGPHPSPQTPNSMSKRRRTSGGRAAAPRPIDKTLRFILLDDVNATQQQNQLFIATTACTVLGIRWSLLIEEDAGTVGVPHDYE